MILSALSLFVMLIEGLGACVPKQSTMDLHEIHHLQWLALKTVAWNQMSHPSIIISIDPHKVWAFSLRNICFIIPHLQVLSMFSPTMDFSDSVNFTKDLPSTKETLWAKWVKNNQSLIICVKSGQWHLSIAVWETRHDFIVSIYLFLMVLEWLSKSHRSVHVWIPKQIGWFDVSAYAPIWRSSREVCFGTFANFFGNQHMSHVNCLIR